MADGTITIFANERAAKDDLLKAEEKDHWPKSGDIVDTKIWKLTYDSIVIRLYPFAWNNYHLKSVNNYIAKERLVVYMEAWPQKKIEFSIESPIKDNPPAGNINTMLTHKAYGNVRNRLVCELFDTNSIFIKRVFDEKNS